MYFTGAEGVSVRESAGKRGQCRRCGEMKRRSRASSVEVQRVTACFVRRFSGS